MRRNKTGETSEPIPFEYIPLNLGRRSDRPFDFIANLFATKLSPLKEDDTVPLNLPSAPIVIDLVSPENETISSVVQQPIPHDEDHTMEVMDSHSDVDSSMWTSCEGSPAPFDSQCNESEGLTEYLQSVSDPNCQFDQIGYQPQVEDTAPLWDVISGFSVYENGLERIYNQSGEQIETGFPGPMDEYYEEIRRQALKVRPL